MANTTPTTSLNIKSAARKLPIKRKTPPRPQSPNPNPNFPSPADNNNGFDDFDYDDEPGEEEEEEEEEEDPSSASASVSAAAAAGIGDVRPPPFKFHRVWSEPDEIRFLQGLLGCFSQGMVFPRDLNLFYDRFSESMPQPYTRSQLSEKLRRLRRKFRIMTGRIAAGRDPARLAPHDRDLLHLCTRLWHPSYAASSPFSTPDPAGPVNSGTPGNKRRRANPRPPLPSFPLLLPSPSTSSPPPIVIETKKTPALSKGSNPHRHLAGVVMDAFDGSLKELRMDIAGREQNPEGDFARRWQEQRLEELDVLARRLRLVIEDSIRS